MPFLEDTDVDEGVYRRPIWGTFVLVKDNLEKLIAVNLLWAIQLMPAIAAFGFPELPLWLRLLLFIYSTIAVAIATGALYGLVAHICQDEALQLELVKETLSTLAVPSLLRLIPLYTLLGALSWGVFLLAPAQLVLPEVILRVVILLLLTCSIYWGPLFIAHPQRSPLFVLRQSIALVWRFPRQTLFTGLFILAALLLGLVSIGGVFLIVPVLVALFQTRRYLSLVGRIPIQTSIAEA